MKYYIAFFIMCLAVSVNAQNLVNYGATISIQPNTTFAIGGDATNNGTIINNGNFLISGAWINNGTYDPGVGDFTLNSPGDQIVNHNAQAFERLIIRGGGNKIFQADITINEDIDLQDGVMQSTNGARLIIGENAQITGGSTNAYIDGPLYMHLSEISFFPIGTDTQYLPVTLNNVDATDALVGFEAISPNPIEGFNPEDAGAISAEYAWQMTVESGTYNGSQITLPVVNQDFVEDISKAIVMQASLDVYSSLGQSSFTGNGTDGTVTSLSSAIGMFFTIGYLEGISETLKELNVFNVITPATKDGLHDFLKIENIEQYPENTVNIYNRWGSLVYEISGYDNVDVIFDGQSNVGGSRDLDNGTYFYAIEAGGKVKTGFFVIRR